MKISQKGKRHQQFQRHQCPQQIPADAAAPPPRYTSHTTSSFHSLSSSLISYKPPNSAELPLHFDTYYNFLLYDRIGGTTSGKCHNRHASSMDRRAGERALRRGRPCRRQKKIRQKHLLGHLRPFPHGRAAGSPAAIKKQKFLSEILKLFERERSPIIQKEVTKVYAAANTKK